MKAVVVVSALSAVNAVCGASVVIVVIASARSACSGWASRARGGSLKRLQAPGVWRRLLAADGV